MKKQADKGKVIEAYQKLLRVINDADQAGFDSVSLKTLKEIVDWED